MATFAIYKIILHSDDNLFNKDSQRNLPKAQELLGRILHNMPSLYKERKNGDRQPYTTKILREDNNIVVMRISDPKDVKLIDVQQNPYDTVSFPPCYVIFDNRPGKGLLAIERRSDAFNSDTDKVRDLLEESLRNGLAQYSLSVDINIKKRVDEFWNIVDSNLLQNDIITNVKFNFPNPKYNTPIATDQSQDFDIMRYLTAVTEAVKATKGVLEMSSDGNRTLEMKNEGVIGHMVSLCGKNGYDISVTFEKYGEFKYGDEQRMLQLMPPLAIEHYVQGFEGNSLFGLGHSPLLDWLDKIFNESNTYTDGHSINTKKKRNRKIMR